MRKTVNATVCCHLFLSFQKCVKIALTVIQSREPVLSYLFCFCWHTHECLIHFKIVTYSTNSYMLMVYTKNPFRKIRPNRKITFNFIHSHGFVSLLSSTLSIHSLICPMKTPQSNNTNINTNSCSERQTIIETQVNTTDFLIVEDGGGKKKNALWEISSDQVQRD